MDFVSFGGFPPRAILKEHLLHQTPHVLWKPANPHAVRGLEAANSQRACLSKRTSTSNLYRRPIRASNFAGVRFWTREILSFRSRQRKRGCAFSVHSLKQFIYRNLRPIFSGCRARRFAFEGSGRAEIAVQRRVGGIENEVAIAAFRKMMLDLALDRRGQLSL